MVSIFNSGDEYVWIPVARPTTKVSYRAFLPTEGLTEIYRYGYKAQPSEASYLDALRAIQAAYLSNESKVFVVEGGTKQERQYKAKWRHGRRESSPLLGPTAGWVRIAVESLPDTTEAVLAEILQRGDPEFVELPVAKRMFGEISGYPVGSTFESRLALSQAGVHGPTQAAISGDPKVGSDSIVVSGGCGFHARRPVIPAYAGPAFHAMPGRG